MKTFHLFVLASIIFLIFSSCSPTRGTDTGRLTVVASTQIIGDIVSAIGGDLIQVEDLIPPGTDPHAFEPAPQDAVRISEADLIFINGLGLEQTLQPLLVDQRTKVVTVSEGIDALTLTENGESGPDPHVWMNPLNLEIWVDNIASALGALDPENQAAYEANASAYKSSLDQIDEWALSQVSQIPADQRILVTDHESFGYFADHYGFQIIGAIIPSYSTLSEPSAGELAEIESRIQEFGVKAIFVGLSLNPSLADRVAADTGIQLVPVYTETLSDSNGPASTYLDMIRFDVQAIVTAVK